MKFASRQCPFGNGDVTARPAQNCGSSYQHSPRRLFWSTHVLANACYFRTISLAHRNSKVPHISWAIVTNSLLANMFSSILHGDDHIPVVAPKISDSNGPRKAAFELNSKSP